MPSMTDRSEVNRGACAMAHRTHWRWSWKYLITKVGHGATLGLQYLGSLSKKEKVWGLPSVAHTSAHTHLHFEGWILLTATHFFDIRLVPWDLGPNFQVQYKGCNLVPCGLQRADSNVELVPTTGLHDLQRAPCDCFCRISDHDSLRQHPSTSSYLN